jgi:hypothetical protein
MKIKFGVLYRFKNFKALVENHIGKNIKAIMCDGGGKYNSKNFNVFCKENGIAKQTITPYFLKSMFCNN